MATVTNTYPNTMAPFEDYSDLSPDYSGLTTSVNTTNAGGSLTMENFERAYRTAERLTISGQIGQDSDSIKQPVKSNLMEAIKNPDNIGIKAVKEALMEMMNWNTEMKKRSLEKKQNDLVQLKRHIKTKERELEKMSKETIGKKPKLVAKDFSELPYEQIFTTEEQSAKVVYSFTKPVIVDKKYLIKQPNAGRFIVRVDFSRADLVDKIRIRSLDRLPYGSRNFDHPCIEESRICFGDTHDTFTDLFQKFDIVGILDLVYDFLSSGNVKNAWVKNWNEWLGGAKKRKELRFDNISELFPNLGAQQLQNNEIAISHLPLLPPLPSNFISQTQISPMVEASESNRAMTAAYGRVLRARFTSEAIGELQNWERQVQTIYRELVNRIRAYEQESEGLGRSSRALNFGSVQANGGGAGGNVSWSSISTLQPYYSSNGFVTGS